MECGIHYLRAIAEESGLKDHECLIIVVHNVGDNKGSVHEYVTAVPHQSGSGKRDLEGNLIKTLRHARWIAYSPDWPSGSVAIQSGKDVSSTWDQDQGTGVESRAKAAECQGELFEHCQQMKIKHDGWTWEHLPRLYRLPNAPYPSTQNYVCPSLLARSPCECFAPGQETPIDAQFKKQENLDNRAFFRWIGHFKMDLYLLRKQYFTSRGRRAGFKSVDTDARLMKRKPDMTPIVAIQYLSPTFTNRDRLPEYMCCISRIGQHNLRFETSAGITTCGIGISLISDSHQLSRPGIISLQILEKTTQLYEKLEGARISLKVVTQPLYTAF